jgi:hypothetical protein
MIWVRLVIKVPPQFNNKKLAKKSDPFRKGMNFAPLDNLVIACIPCPV